MKVAIIAAFDYNIFPRQINSVSKLIGTQHDINHSISIAQSLQIENSNIYVLSDIKNFQFNTNKHKGINFQFYSFANYEQLLIDIYSIAQISEKIFFYLTGHGETDFNNQVLNHKCFVSLEETSDSFQKIKIPTKTFLDVIVYDKINCLRIYKRNELTLVNKLKGTCSFENIIGMYPKRETKKIFAIIDTCFSENMLGLKYKYDNSNFQEINLMYRENKQNIQITTLTSNQYRGISTKSGSHFTNNLIIQSKLLTHTHTVRDISRLFTNKELIINVSHANSSLQIF